MIEQSYYFSCVSLLRNRNKKWQFYKLSKMPPFLETSEDEKDFSSPNSIILPPWNCKALIRNHSRALCLEAYESGEQLDVDNHPSHPKPHWRRGLKETRIRGIHHKLKLYLIIEWNYFLIVNNTFGRHHHQIQQMAINFKTC